MGLLHAGDCLAEWAHSSKDLEDFALWFGSQPHRDKVVIGGNHDRSMEELGATRTKEIFAQLGGCIYLHPDLNQPVCLSQGIRLVGLPWSVRTNPNSNNKAFQPPWDDVRLGQVPSCDILMTHGPPYAALDLSRGSKLLRN